MTEEVLQRHDQEDHLMFRVQLSAIRLLLDALTWPTFTAVGPTELWLLHRALKALDDIPNIASCPLCKE